MSVDRTTIRRNRLGIGLETLLLFLALGVFTALVGYIAFGPPAALAGLAIGLGSLFLTPGGVPEAVLRSGRVRPLSYRDAPRLVELAEDLGRRAGLPESPGLGYLNSPTPNALTVGDRNRSLIVVTAGLISRLNEREVRAVLAHEVGHIANGDLRLLDAVNRLGIVTGWFARVGLVVALLFFPVLLFTGMLAGPMALLLLTGAPLVSMAMQRAISRRREFAADLTAAELTGDPAALASALDRLRRPTAGIFGMVLHLPRPEQGSLFTTHPPTDERIARLEELIRDRGRRRPERRVEAEVRFL